MNKYQQIKAVLIIFMVTVLSVFVFFPSYTQLAFSRNHGTCRPDGNATGQTTSCYRPGAGSFSNHKLNVTILVSYPGSGNTWVRHLLTTSTGILTGSLYDVYHDVHANRERAPWVIVVKTHQSPKHTKTQAIFNHVVHLIRNPYESLLSDFNRKSTYVPIPYFNMLKTHPVETFSTEWSKHVSKTINDWVNMNLPWAQDGTPTHVVVYHRLENHLERELRLLLAFLNQPTDLIHCALQAREGFAHRKKPDWQFKMAVFTAEQRKQLNKHIDMVQKALEKKTGQDFSDFQQWKR